MSYPLIAISLLATSLFAAGPQCPAGMPLGSIQLSIKRSHPEALPIHRINQIEEGDQILYSPELRPKEKRDGEVSIVLVAPGKENDFAILDAKDADKPAQWTVPFRASLAVYVFGPNGLSSRKLKRFLSKDEELIAQLADYAEKTAQTEAVLQALSRYETNGQSDNLGAALQGFAGQYGINYKIDRNQPLDQQTLAAFRTLNPALSAYDPVSPYGSQRMSQTAGLAATVAGMFLGSTVGLAAGGTAMALNLKTLMFPDTDFRSAYSQSTVNQPLALCTTRDAQRSRTRIAYLWALRLPNSGPPKLKVGDQNHIPKGLKSIVAMEGPEPKKLLSRIREWTLTPDQGSPLSIPATAIPDKGGLEINLANADIPAGKYKVAGLWDWDPVNVDGDLFVEPLGALDRARLTPMSQNNVRERSGKQLITLQGSDFEFLDKAAVINRADKYAAPVPIPFSLPRGPGRGPQDTVEMQVDTSAFSAGEYALLLYQRDGKPTTVDMKVLPDPPKLERLPLTINHGEREMEVVLEGEGLDRITGVAADGVQFDLEPPKPETKRRAARVVPSGALSEGASLDLRVSVKDYAQPLLFANALAVAGPKPRILEASPSLPSGLQIALRRDELPAGTHIGIMMRVASAGSDPAIELGCGSASRIRIPSGSERNGVKLQSMQASSLFLSLDPGSWPSGCTLKATLHTKNSGKSAETGIGRIVRLPKIEKFELTDESAGDGAYYGILTGQDLELIGQVGWAADAGNPIAGLPVPIVGEGAKQSLKVRLPWPSPTPRAPLFIWFRGEDEGRSTTIRP